MRPPKNEAGQSPPPSRREGEVLGADMRRLISSGSPFEAETGYSRAVVDSEWIFVAGTTGFDYAQMTIVDAPAEQARQAFRNIEAALAEAGAGPPRGRRGGGGFPAPAP